MGSLFILVKEALAIFAPFIAMELYLRHFYQTGIVKCAIWWYKFRSEMDYLGLLLFIMLFIWFALYATFSHLVQAGALAFHGEQHRMVYIGDVNKERSLFVSADDLNSEPQKYSRFTKGFNYSFSTIYTETYFARDKGTDRLGVTINSFSFASLLTSFVMLAAFILPAMAAMHALAYPISIGLENTQFEPVVPAMEAFQKLLGRWNLNVVPMVFANFGILFLGIIASANIKPETFGRQIINLPESITPGYEIEGLPILVKHHTDRRSTGSRDGYSDVDTGFRTIVFKFEKDFPTPVYASTYYDSREKPGLGDLAYQNSQTNTKMKLKILDDLNIEVINETTKSSN